MNRKYRKQIPKNKTRLLGLACLLIWSPLLLLVLRFSNVKKAEDTYQCSLEETLKLKDNIPQIRKSNVKTNKPSCFNFNAINGQRLTLNTNTKITLLTPSKKVIFLRGSSKNILTDTGKYSILINTHLNASYQIELRIEEQSIANKPGLKTSESQSHSPQGNNVPLQLSYNVDILPPFNSNQELQKIVDSISKLVESRGLPTERLSVSLVDLSSSECCPYASYLDNKPRFPASIVKLFWMVALYGQYEAGIIPEGTITQKELYKMIQDSSNESASRVLDKITQTESGENLPKTKLKNWVFQRYSVNHFFKTASYTKINISQKTFPIPYLKLEKPNGRDMQIRKSVENPDRNYLTTYNVARLLFEIHTGQSISKDYSKKMKSLLKRDLGPAAWKQKPYNSISGFLGESLPVDTDFASKMGWTFSNRNDAAIVVSPDRKTHYILVIFGDDPSFYEDKKLFPEISRMVYEKMNSLNSS